MECLNKMLHVTIANNTNGGQIPKRCVQFYCPGCNTLIEFTDVCSLKCKKCNNTLPSVDFLLKELDNVGHWHNQKCATLYYHNSNK